MPFAYPQFAFLFIFLLLSSLNERTNGHATSMETVDERPDSAGRLSRVV